MARKPSSRSRKQPQPNGLLVFISHATADKWVATVLCEKFEAIGARTFRDDRDIQGGDDIPNEIQDQIRACDEFVVLLTPASVTRPWVLLEVGMALVLRKRVVPILQHVDAHPIPEMIKSIKRYDVNDVERYVTEVASRVRQKKKMKVRR